MEKIRAEIRAVRQALEDADREERKALLEQLCVLYARLQALIK